MMMYIRCIIKCVLPRALDNSVLSHNQARNWKGGGGGGDAIWYTASTRNSQNIKDKHADQK